MVDDGILDNHYHKVFLTKLSVFVQEAMISSGFTAHNHSRIFAKPSALFKFIIWPLQYVFSFHFSHPNNN